MSSRSSPDIVTERANGRNHYPQAFSSLADFSASDTPGPEVAELLASIHVLSLFTAKGRRAGRLWKYYWDTIVACVDPETILQAMRDAGFVDVKRHVALGTFSEYTGRRPEDPAAPDRDS